MCASWFTVRRLEYFVVLVCFFGAFFFTAAARSPSWILRVPVYTMAGVTVGAFLAGPIPTPSVTGNVILKDCLHACGPFIGFWFGIRSGRFLAHREQNPSSEGWQAGGIVHRFLVFTTAIPVFLAIAGYVLLFAGVTILNGRWGTAGLIALALAGASVSEWVRRLRSARPRRVTQLDP